MGTRILNLSNGAFQVYQLSNEHFDIVFQRKDGTFRQWNVIGFDKMDEVVKAWCNIMYIRGGI